MWEDHAGPLTTTTNSGTNVSEEIRGRNEALKELQGSC